MRRNAGPAKARELKPGLKIRITQGKVRKVIFDVLAGLVEERFCADIFAGLGSLGLEALRRGAGRVIFIEKEERWVDMIKDELERYNFSRKGEVWVKDAFQSLPLLKEKGWIFDLFFMDPPYDYAKTVEFLEAFCASDIFAGRAVGVVEHSRHLSLPERPGHFSQWKEKRFGETLLTFYRRITETN